MSPLEIYNWIFPCYIEKVLNLLGVTVFAPKVVVNYRTALLVILLVSSCCGFIYTFVFYDNAVALQSSSFMAMPIEVNIEKSTSNTNTL